MFPVGLVAWGGKLALLWAGGVSVLLADFQFLDTNSGFGVVGALIVVVGMAVLTVRSTAIRDWKATSEARLERIHEQTEQIKALQLQAETIKSERDEQRDLKHGLASELEAERKIRDLTPVLQNLTGLQQELVSQRHMDGQAFGALRDAIDRLARTFEEQGTRIKTLGETQAAQTRLLEALAERIEALTRERA